MSVETVESVEPVAKYQRSVALEKHVADRMHKVCEHLGVTVGAFMKQAIGEAVSRHEIALFPKQAGANMEAMLAQFFLEAAKQVGEDGGDEQVQPARKARATKAK